MPFATTADNVKLYYEEAGSGTPILFSHEFAADYRNWEPQMRHFSRRHRVITYSARGYKPSDIPADASAYSYKHWISDAVAILDHLKIAKAHFVGLSMGGYAGVLLAAQHRDRLLSLTAAGVGSGSERGYAEAFRKTFLDTADAFEKLGGAHVARTYGLSPARIAFEVKDPRGFAAFNEGFASHDPQGSARTLRGFQAARPSIYDFEADIRKIATPTLVIVGDEDDPCLEPSVRLKQWIPTSGLAVFPKSGHAVNEEEPALFNATVGDFIARVEAGRWGARDPRSYRS
ncbi:MAG TPA: alpha/beta fold hydrolase [Xanthobacteraceae bacterium]|jgi:proline iminopeptidase|nr:alpha/beta fold hydrolase [Xanthobacteraceae bacterium]